MRVTLRLKRVFWQVREEEAENEGVIGRLKGHADFDVATHRKLCRPSKAPSPKQHAFP